VKKMTDSLWRSVSTDSWDELGIGAVSIHTKVINSRLCEVTHYTGGKAYWAVYAVGEGVLYRDEADTLEIAKAIAEKYATK
jgi:hypothetical protein